MDCLFDGKERDASSLVTTGKEENIDASVLRSVKSFRVGRWRFPKVVGHGIR